MALNGLICAEVPLGTTHSITHEKQSGAVSLLVIRLELCVS